MFDVLAEPRRRQILDLLLEEPRSVTELVERTGLSQPGTSKHLRVLREAGLVRAQERGRENHYTLDARPLAEVQRSWLDQFAPFWEASLERLKRRAERS